MAESTSTTWREFQLLRRLEFVAGAAAIVVLCRAAFEEDLSWVAWATACTAVLLLATIRRPYGALVVLIGMSAMPRFFVELFGWNARPEHFAVAIVSVAVTVWLLRHKLDIRLEQLDYWVLAYVVINYASSAFASSEPSATLRWALLNNLAVLPYFLIRFLVQDVQTLGRAIRILLAVGIAESVYGILCYASHHAFGTATGMEIGAYLVDIAAPYGSQFEPNLFGAYTACCAVLFLALYVVKGQHRLGSLIGFLVASLATVLSFSRAALIALVIAVGWVLWKARHPRNGGHTKLAILILGLGLTSVIAATGVGGILLERLGNLYSLGLAEETTITRVVTIVEALRDIPKHPLLGSGTASSQLSFEWAQYVPEWAGNSGWVGNVTVRILHDTGILGFTALLGFLLSVWWKIRLGLGGRSDHAPMLIGLSAGALLYAISFQSTDGTTLAFCWVHLGLLASGAILMSSPSHNYNTLASTTAGARSSYPAVRDSNFW